MHVLLVEDDQEMIELLEILLREMAGWRVTPVTDPTLVLEQPDIVEDVELALVDLRMAPIEGPELVRRLRERGDVSFPVVYLTGQRPTAEELQLVDGAVQKPFTYQELMDQLQRILGDHFPG